MVRLRLALAVVCFVFCGVLFLCSAVYATVLVATAAAGFDSSLRTRYTDIAPTAENAFHAFLGMAIPGLVMGLIFYASRGSTLAFRVSRKGDVDNSNEGFRN